MTDPAPIDAPVKLPNLTSITTTPTLFAQLQENPLYAHDLAVLFAKRKDLAILEEHFRPLAELPPLAVQVLRQRGKLRELDRELGALGEALREGAETGLFDEALPFRDGVWECGTEQSAVQESEQLPEQVSRHGPDHEPKNLPKTREAPRRFRGWLDWLHGT